MTADRRIDGSTDHGVGSRLALGAALAVAVSACGVDVPCAFDPNRSIYQNPDATVQASPLHSAPAVDSIGLYMGWLRIAPRASVPAHVHEGAEEIVFVTCGGGAVFIGADSVPVSPQVTVVVPPDREHRAVAGPQGLVAVQFYRPGTPGKRFYEWTRVR